MNVHLGLLWAIDLVIALLILPVFVRPLRVPLTWLGMATVGWLEPITWRISIVFFSSLGLPIYLVHLHSHSRHAWHLGYSRPLNLLPLLILSSWLLAGLNWLFYAEEDRLDEYVRSSTTPGVR